jgi:transposase-like protein
MTTLADIARNHGVTPQAVGKWRDAALSKYGELPYEQVGKRKQYTPDAVAKILEFAPSRPIRRDFTTGMTTPEPPAVKVPVEIYEGNDSTALDIPELPETVDLEQFRREGSVEIDLSTAQAAIVLTQQLGTVMEADIAQRWQQLQATQKAAKDLAKATQELDRQAMAYRIESGILAKLQANESESVQELLAKVQSLGKGQANPQPKSGA